MVTLYHFLFLSAILFALGIVGVVSRRNAVSVLIGVELILNAANINFVAFSRYCGQLVSLPGVPTQTTLDGQVFAIFIIILAACEAALALAIIINLFNAFGSIDIDQADSMQG
jgi:NADH-quinone oxidoreductase subunit K